MDTFVKLFLGVVCILQGTFLLKAQKLPNIVIILVDDMGFSDIGCYGGEIPTPNIDRLAADGVRLTNFYNAGRSCPTRASLLTGLYPHQAGMGFMAGDRYKDIPAYQGYLNNASVTIGEAMQDSGYFTIITGKWHVGQKGDGGITPWRRGFDRSFNTIAGNFYYRDARAQLYLNGRRVRNAELPENWYTTDLWTSYGLEFIDEAKKEGKPFLLYLAHNAPHYPLQAPEEEIAKFRGKFMKGWEVLREERYDRQVKMGIIDKSHALPAINPLIPKWETLSEEEKIRQDDLMAVYAAVISCMDKSVGDLIEGLKERGEYENTIIMFLSDNGGNSEGGTWGRYIGEKPGAINSHLSVSQGWAELNNTPFWLYKRHTSEGGILTPFIMTWPEGMDSNLKGKILPSVGHLIDIMPTCIEIAKGEYPTIYKGNKISPMEGISLYSLLSGKPVERTKPLYWEHEGNRAVRHDKWKIVSNVREPWQLYNLETDRTETKDLAKDYPEILSRMVSDYEDWADKVGVRPYNYPPKKWQIMQGQQP